MDAPDVRLPAVAIAALVMTALGCSGAPEPELGSRPTRAAQEIAEAKAEAAATEQEAAVVAEPAQPPPDAGQAEEDPSGPAPVRERAPGTLVVISEGGSPEGERLIDPPAPEPTLYEASQAEKERRRSAERSRVVITDANLNEHAAGGNLTELVTEPFPDDGAAERSEAGERDSDPEQYWRDRVRESRLTWRAAADRVVELEEEIARLRYEFYAEDDPYYRDAEIKPAWDRAVVELEQARFRTEEARLGVRLVLEAGRRDNALPGWLREGLEFEPDLPEDDEPGRDELPTVEAIDAPVLEEPPS